MSARRADVPDPRPLVLLAEDDEELRDLLAWALRRDGYAVRAFADGASLRRWLAGPDPTESLPALLVTDVRMPGPTGLSVLASLRGGGWSVPVIVISAFADAETRTEALGLGADAVFAKPFDLDDLRTAVVRLAPRTPPR